jgi:fucose permease
MAGIEPVTVVAISGAFVCGLVLALLGSLKQTLAEEGETPGRRAHSLFAALNLCLIPMTLLCGVLVDRWGARGILLAGSAALAAALLALSVRPEPPRDFLAVLLAGLGGAALWTSSTVVMPQAFYPAEPTASVNLGYVFLALGALVGPALLDVLVRSLGRKKALAALAFVCLVPAFPAALAGSGALDVQADHTEVGVLLTNEHVWLGALVFFFYVPLEAAVGVWTTAYLTQYSQTERPGAWMSTFWAAFVASRLLTAVGQHANIVPAWSEGWILVLLPLLVAVVLGNLAGTTRRTAARSGLVILGLLLGPLFPTLIGVVLRRHPDEQGTALGLMFALGSLGSLVLGPLFGRDAKQSIQTALRIPMLIALAVTASVLVFSLTVP